ncbi:MAG: helix-turn-helix domain-containing protein [Campylobacteraceae bacterium]
MESQKIAIIDERVIANIVKSQEEILSLLKDKKQKENNLLSVKEAAISLKISEQKIRQMVDSGEIKYKKIGRIIRIFADSLI